MTYKASLDNLAKAVTIGVTVLFAFIIFGQFSIIKDAGRATPIYTTVTCILVYFIALAFRPINYMLTSDHLIIHRLFADVKIQRSQIKSVELLDKAATSCSIRTFGVGGLFGYYGKFANTKRKYDLVCHTKKWNDSGYNNGQQENNSNARRSK
jgi:Bacterial PH domain